MLEIDHDDLRYAGQVRVSILPEATTAIGTFTLQGTTSPLPPNGLITFLLQTQHLQLGHSPVQAKTISKLSRCIQTCSRSSFSGKRRV